MGVERHLAEGGRKFSHGSPRPEKGAALRHQLPVTDWADTSRCGVAGRR